MFNRSNYDRSAYDRTNNLENDISSTIRGTSNLDTNLVLKTNLYDFSIGGNGSLNGSLLMKQTMSVNFSGSSSLDVSSMKLIQRLPVNMQSYGDLIPGVSVRSPLGEIRMTGYGEFVDHNTYIRQSVTDNVEGTGDLKSSLVLVMPIGTDLTGTSDMNVDKQFVLRMRIDGDISSTGGITSARVGELNSDTIEFTGLGLKPGQTLIIDTDDLDVYIDNILNVSSVTTDSVFFQLKPGENELIFTSPNNPKLAVTIVWQNRWL